ncbi:MAG: amidohydrolase family protein [bacterium]|nr:amidohydrolase family protein [bacterium]
MGRLLIRAGCIVSLDPDIGDLPRGDVLIENGKILAVGPKLEAGDVEVVDASDTIVLPGFVDTHRHVWQAAARSVTADWSLMDYFRGIRMRVATTFRPQDMYAAQYAGALEALDAGVTTVVDYCHNLLTPDHAWESIRGLRDAGLRAVWCFGFNSPPGMKSHWESREEMAKFAGEIAAEHFASRDALLSFGIAPEEPGLAPPEACEFQYRTARELDARITQHVNCVRVGRDPEEVSRLLAPRDLLGPDVLLVHMGYTTDEEWRMVADSGAAVSFTPETELQMGMGIPSTGVVRRFDIIPTYGADIVSNNSGDMFFPLRLALQVERGVANTRIVEAGSMPEGVTVSCREILEWGTLGGAKAAGLERQIGSLTPGKQADLVLIRSDGIGFAGWNQRDPLANVVLQANASNVDTVLVGGEIVKRNGVLCADATAARELLADAARHVARETEALGGFHVPGSGIEIP